MTAPIGNAGPTVAAFHRKQAGLFVYTSLFLTHLTQRPLSPLRSLLLVPPSHALDIAEAAAWPRS
jgi:hypothetical protein